MDKIRIESTYWNENEPDFIAEMTLVVPREALIKYSEEKGLGKTLPDGRDFWVGTSLAEKLKNSGKRPERTYNLDLEDALEFLGSGNICCEYRDVGDFVELRLQEIRE